VTSPITVHQIEHWAVERLIVFAANARTHTREQIVQIAASIVEFGFVNPILVGEDGVIIAGHARLLAAKQLGMTQVPVIILAHLSQIQRRALVIADNQLALNAGWDEEMLRRELISLQNEDFSLDLIGFEDAELTRILAAEDQVAGIGDEDAVPAVAETAITRPGELWNLGDHKVLCGDALSLHDVDQLLAGETADLMFTDPPYNLTCQRQTEDRLKIQGDPMTANQFCQFLHAAFTSHRRTVKPGVSIYVCHPWYWQRELQGALEAAGFAVHCQIIWAKQTLEWGFGPYKLQHEPIFYGHLAGQKNSWYGNKSQSTLWEENEPMANREPATAKPVALIERALVNSSQPGDLVVDLFGGFGSTLIGCERRGRKSRLMEIDPRHVDVTVRRWQEYTGKPALLDGEGLNFEEIADQRRKQQQGRSE